MRYLVSFTALTLFIMTTGGRLEGSEKLLLHLILWGYLYCAIATTEKTLLGNTSTPHQWRAAGQHTWMGWDGMLLHWLVDLKGIWKLKHVLNTGAGWLQTRLLYRGWFVGLCN